MSLARLVGLLARCCHWLVRREAMRTKEHRRENDARDCVCEPCQWRRGIEADADETLGAGKWGP